MEPQAPVDPKIIKAVLATRKAVKSLVHDETNQHGGYSYVSIDSYYKQVVPHATTAGLTWRVRETEWEMVPNMGRERNRTYVRASFSYDLFAEDAMAADYMYFTVILPLEGAQTTGQMFSYADKVFMRVAFSIPTGEKDADANATEATHSSPKGVGAQEKKFSDGDVPPGVDPITGEILPTVQSQANVDLENAGTLTSGKTKAGDPEIDTRKIDDKSVAIIEGIFTTWMPTIKTRSQLTDWHATNVAALEKIKKVDPVAHERIKGMFNEKNMQLKAKETK